MSEQTDTPPAAIKSYRRSRRSRRRSRVGSPKYGMLIGVAMTIALMGYVAGKAAQFYFATIAYSGVAIGSSPAEVLYALGEPSLVRSSSSVPWAKSAAQSPDGSQWRYPAPLTEVRYDQAGRVENVLCDFDERTSRLPCPPALGVNVQDDEAELLEKLGRPSSVYIVRGRKVMRYDETGYEFTLERLRVRSIRLTSIGGNPVATTVRFLIWMVP